MSASDQAGNAGAKPSVISWPEGRAAYDRLLGRLPGYVDAAPLILCSMGACVDARVAMHDMDGLLAARDCPPATALAALLQDRAARGVGGEVWVDWPHGPQWLAGHVPVRYALGGTGPQAAWVLTTLGAKALMALEDRSEHMMAQLDGRLLLLSTLLIAGLFRALDAFRVFDLVYVLTGGGPADSTETLSTLSYKVLFSTLQFGYGSTLSTAMFVTEAALALGFGIFIRRSMKAQQ